MYVIYLRRVGTTLQDYADYASDLRHQQSGPSAKHQMRVIRTPICLKWVLSRIASHFTSRSRHE